MTLQPISSSKLVTNSPFLLKDKHSPIEEAEQLVKSFKEKPFSRADITAKARLLIERFNSLVQKNLEQNLPLVREGLCRLLKLDIEEIQLEVVFSLQSIIHIDHLEHDIQHTGIETFIALEKHLSQMIGSHLRPSSFSKAVEPFLSLYHSALERLWVLTHLTEKKEENILPQQQIFAMLHETHSWFAFLKQEPTHAKSLIYLLKSVQEILQKIEASISSNSLNAKQQVYSYLAESYAFLGNPSKAQECQEKASQLLGEPQNKATGAGPSLGKTPPQIPPLHLPSVADDLLLTYPTTPRKRTTIFISYSWTQSSEVDALEQALLTLDVEIIRDKKKLQYTDNLESFMRAGAQTTEHTVVVISPSYLKSRNCLYELFHLLHNEKIARRLLIATHQLKIDHPGWSEEYEIHWKKEAESLEKKLTSLHTSKKESTEKELKLYYAFQNLLSEKLPPFLKEAFSFEELQSKQYSPFKKVIFKNLLPKPTHYFTGRNAILETLSSRLKLIASSPTQWIALIGEAGIGKTQLACKLMQQQQDNYSLILFLDATSAKSLSESYQRAATCFGLEEEHLFDLKEIGIRLAEEKKPWLLVYDNLQPHDSTMLEAALPKTGGAILVTSRYAKNLTSGFESFLVEPLAPAEATSILERLLPEEEVQKKNEFKDLAHAACYHPYALMQAVRFISKQLAFNTHDYIKLLEEERYKCIRRATPFIPLQFTTALLSKEQGLDVALAGTTKQTYLESPHQGRTFWILHSSDEIQEADAISTYLQTQGIKTVQWISDPLEDREDFQQKLRKVEQIIVLASPSYLKSQACMPTLFYILQEPEIEKKVLPVLTKGAKVHRAEYAKPYIEHWEKVFQKLEEDLYSVEKSSHLLERLPSSDLFKAFLSQILETKWRTMLITSFEEFQKDNYAILQSITNQGDLPQPTQHFLGRDDLLQDIKSHLVPPDIYTWGMPTKLGILRGVGGLGKTQLSRKFAIDQKSRYRLVFFFDSETELTLTQSYLKLAKRLGVDKRADIGQMELKDLKKHIHTHLKHHQPYLFVYDNVEFTDSGWRGFEQELPKAGGSVLITTRRYSESGVGHVFNVEAFTLNEGVKLLKQFIPTERYTEESIHKLADILDKVPLALNQAGQFIMQNNLTATDYIELLLQKNTQSLDSDDINPVAATCNTALSVLEKVSPHAKNILALSSCLASSPIDISWLISFEVKASTYIYLKLKISRALGYLERYGLILVDEKTQTFTLHRLVQKAVRQSIKVDLSRSIPLGFQDALKLLEQQCLNYDPGTMKGRWETGDKLLPHVESIAQYAQEGQPEIASLATILNQAGKYAYTSGKFQKSIDFYKQSLEILIKVYGEQHFNVMQSLASLGDVHASLEGYQTAIEYHEKALQIARELDNREGIKVAYGRLVSIYRSLGEYQKIIECEEKVLESFPDFSDRESLRLVYESMSIAYGFLEEHQKSIEYAKKSLEISQDLGILLGIGKAYHEIGVACYALGEYRQSLEYHRKYLESAFSVSKMANYSNLKLTFKHSSIINKIKKIKDELNIGNIPLAQEQLELLYEDGVHIVNSEIKQEPLLEDVIKIIFELNNILSGEKIEEQTEFFKFFTKVYRIFLELAGYQFMHRQQPMNEDIRQGFIHHANRSIEMLQKNDIATKFEYKCSKQVIKLLSIPQNIYFSYRNHLANLVDTSSSISIAEIVQAAKSLVIDVKKDWIEDWYLDVHQMRWLSYNVLTIDDFNIFISPEADRFKKKGHYYTLCLAHIFLELIKKSSVEDKVKKTCVTCLIGLLSLRDQDRFSSYLNLVPQFLNTTEVANEKADRYYMTRKVILKGMGDLVKDENLKDFKYDISKALLSIKMQTNYQDEKNNIQKKLDELKSEGKEYENYIRETEEYLASTQGGHRAGEDEEVQKAEEELSGAKEDKEAVELEIKTIESVESALENMNKEEEALLEELKEMLG